MNIPRFTATLVLVAATMLFFTHQRVEAMRLSYEIAKKNTSLDKLLDQSKELEYNIIKLQAPTNLVLKLAKSDVKMVLPERWRVLEVSGVRSETPPPALPRFVRAITGVLSLDKEAQATPVID